MGDDPREPEKPQPARPEPARPTSEKPEPVRPASARPTPARERAPAPSRSSGEPGSAEEEGPEAPTPGVEPDVDARTVEIDGATWTVKVEGRAAGGASLAVRSTAPLLLLRFSLHGEGGTSPREALVVGKTLERLTEGQLERAFATSEPVSEPGKPSEIFPGTSSRRGRRGG